MGLQLDNPASPVSITEVKQHLRIDSADTTEDVYLLSLIASATRFVEDETGQQLSLAEAKLTLDRWPSGRELVLPKPPLNAVTGVFYTDPTGIEQTLSPAAYTVDATGKPGRIVLRPGQSWPATDGSANCIRIEFDAGYPTPDAVPSNLRHVILLQVGHWFENREAATDRTITEVPLTLRSILAMNSFPEAVG